MLTRFETVLLAANVAVVSTMAVLYRENSACTERRVSREVASRLHAMGYASPPQDFRQTGPLFMTCPREGPRSLAYAPALIDDPDD